MNRKFIYIGCTVFAMSLLSMTGVQAQEESKDSLVNVAFGKVAQEDLTHAISTVNTSELTKKTIIALWALKVLSVVTMDHPFGDKDRWYW